MSTRGSKLGNFSSRVSNVPSFSMIIVRLQSKWAFLENLYEKNEKYKAGLILQINDLQYRISSSCDPAKINKMKGWVDEKEYKISEVDKNNKTIQIQIEDIKRKIIYYKKV